MRLCGTRSVSVRTVAAGWCMRTISSRIATCARRTASSVKFCYFELLPKFGTQFVYFSTFEAQCGWLEYLSLMSKYSREATVALHRCCETHTSCQCCIWFRGIAGSNWIHWPWFMGNECSLGNWRIEILHLRFSSGANKEADSPLIDVWLIAFFLRTYY